MYTICLKIFGEFFATMSQTDVAYSFCTENILSISVIFPTLLCLPSS